ncbi:P-loop containing nucleoside triphosphate hydrolase protein [Geopyxis carbonaria]|nr:P-loop containing nucleoside triphosphate hydrolase protein [Geopyxis carbonaria]
MPALPAAKKPPKLSKARARLRGVVREDSDDELGSDDIPWTWVYSPTTPNSIIGAKLGAFEVRIGDCVLIKGEGLQGEAYVGMACEFLQNDDDSKMVNVNWFSTESEVTRRAKKRMDFLENELYLNPSYDEVPLESINGRATVVGEKVYKERYPKGVPRKSTEFGKVFVCRRGCNPRTATYTDEFVWEQVYHGRDTNIFELGAMIREGTKVARKKPGAAAGATKKRKRRAAADADAESGDDVDREWDKDLSASESDGGDGGASDDDEFRKGPRTPGKKRQRTAGPAATPKGRKLAAGRSLFTTPKRITVKKPLLFTPLSTRHLSPATHLSTPYALARHQLHVSTLPSALPCRETEFTEVYTHLAAAISDGTGACIYISGTPGTGKTATVREVVTQLQARVALDEIDDFAFVEINGMKVTDPHQSYSLLWEALKGDRVSPPQALSLLEREFSTPSPRRVPCVVLMDELDQLVTRGQGVMYNFFNWPSSAHSRLIVLAVANTMDLPERTLSNKISSRLGLTRITFPGYTHAQLQTIVSSRLAGVAGGIVEADAVQFAARKVAAVSGDARRALDICRRAVEMVEPAAAAAAAAFPPSPSKGTTNGKAGDTAGGRVTIAVIKRAIHESTSSPLQLFLKLLPLASKVFLAALLARVRRSGVAENALGDVFEEAERMAALADEGINELLAGGARQAGLGAVVAGLVDAGVLGVEGRRGERGSRVRILVGEEEVKSALRGDKEVGGMIGE